MTDRKGASAPGFHFKMNGCAARLRQLRMARDLTLQQVASATGYNISSLSRFERDKLNPRAESIGGLAAFYGVPIGFLMNGEESPDTMFACLSIRDRRIIEGLMAVMLRESGDG